VKIEDFIKCGLDLFVSFWVKLKRKEDEKEKK
jgi:hypothetical protein